MGIHKIIYFLFSDKVKNSREKSNMKVRCGNPQDNLFPIFGPNKQLQRKNLARKLDIGIHKIIHFLFWDKVKNSWEKSNMKVRCGKSTR